MSFQDNKTIDELAINNDVNNENKLIDNSSKSKVTNNSKVTDKSPNPNNQPKEPKAAETSNKPINNQPKANQPKTPAPKSAATNNAEITNKPKSTITIKAPQQTRTTSPETTNKPKTDNPDTQSTKTKKTLSLFAPFSEQKPKEKMKDDESPVNTFKLITQPDLPLQTKPKNTQNNPNSSYDKDYNSQENNEQKHIINVNELRSRPPAELIKMAEGFGLVSLNGMLKQEIIYSIMRKVADNKNTELILAGILEVLPEGFGFLRSVESNYLSGMDDIYISPNQVKKFSLRTGDKIFGQVRAPKKGERYFALMKVSKINDIVINTVRKTPHFDNLTPIYPQKRLTLENSENSDNRITNRIIDLVAPLGLGQRCLIAAPPKTGKTVMMQDIAHAISYNHPEVVLKVLLIDERPEEVTDMVRSVKGEVVSSTFDEPAIRHVQVADITIERAKRLVELGFDVVILLDSITRLARAYNTVIPSSGKVLTGGIDSNALQRPKRFFGAARNIENGGSLTIIATALIDTGSRMDEVIFEEFKGTGNAEITLDRKLSEKRIYPAIDIMKSGTRKEELLLSKESLSKTWMLRRITYPMGANDGMEFLLNKIKLTKNNADFFLSMNS